MSVTVTITPAQVQLIATVGTKITFWEETYKVHSVEGVDYYAFQEWSGKITVDTDMTHASHLIVPRLLLLPEGTKIGDGFGREVDADNPGLRLPFRFEA